MTEQYVIFCNKIPVIVYADFFALVEHIVELYQSSIEGFSYVFTTSDEIVCEIFEGQFALTMFQLTKFAMKALGYKTAKITEAKYAKLIADGVDMHKALRGHLAYWAKETI